jgi:RNA polymerase sigma-70 factor (ECF subfamily)
MLGPADTAEQRESVSYAVLTLMERLTPVERAVYVLREAFGYSHAEIAAILGRGEPAVRQLARRAREHVRERRRRFAADPGERRRVTERFLAASASGDLPALLAVLAPDVTLVADGGGRALAPRRPIKGADRVARFLLAITTEARRARFLRSVGVAPTADLHIELTQVNGGPGVVAVAAGTPVTALVLDVAEAAVRTVYLVANPAKLAGLRAGAAP